MTNIPHFDAKTLVRAAVAALLFLVAFAIGTQEIRRIDLSIDMEAERGFQLQVFYSDDMDSPYKAEKTKNVCAGENEIKLGLDVERLRRIRIDFGSFPGKVVVKPIRLHGRDDMTLKWQDFAACGDVDSLSVMEDGSVTLFSEHGDPHINYMPELDLQGNGHNVHLQYFPLIVFVVFAIVLWWLLCGPKGILFDGWIELPRGMWNRPFTLLVIIAILARLALSARIPPCFFFSGWDDTWMSNAAESLLKGEWLGEYDHHTLIKGCIGPMVLAFSTMTGIPFLELNTALYIIACLFFLWILAKFVRNRVVLLLIFVVLLFNPLSFSCLTWQRIYRNGMPLWQVPIVFGSFYMLYIARLAPLHKMLMWAVVSGISLWGFLNTREDGIWIWPFVSVCVLLVAVRSFFVAGKVRDRALRSFVAILPIVVLLVGNLAICLVNKVEYGVAMRNDRDAGNYARVMQDLYLIRPDSADEARLSSSEHKDCFHNIYYSTLQKAYSVSPTLNLASRQIDEALDTWGSMPGCHGRDLILDHMLFAIRDGVAMAGFYRSLAESERFFGNVHRELLEAFDSGKIERRGISFTAMAAPFRSELIPRILSEWWNAILHVARFKTMGTEAIDLSFSQNRWITDVARLSGSRPAADKHEVKEQKPYVDRANSVVSAYSLAMPYAVLFALAGYFVVSLRLVNRENRNSDIVSPWLLATGLLASTLVHTACISYVLATTFSGASTDHYLCASYVQELMFISIVVGMVVALMANRKKGAGNG